MVKSGNKNYAVKIPAYILLSGAIICAILVLKSLAVTQGAFDYHRHVFSVQLYQTIMFICIECGLSAVWFEYLRIKSEK